MFKKLILVVAVLLILPSCTLIQQKVEREVIFAKLGTQYKVISKDAIEITKTKDGTVNGEMVTSTKPIEVIVENVKGEEKIAKVNNPSGLILIDQATYEWLKKLNDKWIVEHPQK
jgi:hypothetical protein